MGVFATCLDSSVVGTRRQAKVVDVAKMSRPRPWDSPLNLGPRGLTNHLHECPSNHITRPLDLNLNGYRTDKPFAIKVNIVYDFKSIYADIIK